MDITWYGLSCFRIIERGVASIVADPFDNSVGLGALDLKADILTVSHDDPAHASIANVKYSHLINSPGEYEIGGVFITGVSTFDPSDPTHSNVVYVYDFGKATVCHLGKLDYVPSQSEIEALGPIDVLLIPVGGNGALNSSQAAEVINIIEPSIVVPMYYHTGTETLGLDPLDKFQKEMGMASYEPVSPLRVSATLPEETQIVVMQRTG